MIRDRDVKKKLKRPGIFLRRHFYYGDRPVIFLYYIKNGWCKVLTPSLKLTRIHLSEYSISEEKKNWYHELLCKLVSRFYQQKKKKKKGKK